MLSLISTISIAPLSYFIQIPSFFETLESPSVEEYKRNQELALAAAVAGRSPERPMLQADPSAYFPDKDDDEDEEEDDAEEILEMLQSQVDRFQAGEPQSQVRFQAGEPPKRVNRASTLSGISKLKKKKGMMKKIGKSIRKLVVD